MIAIEKDPDAVLSYGLDWSNFGVNDAASSDNGWLQGDTISTSTWAVTGADALLVIDSDTNTTTETSVVLSAGTDKKSYYVTNHIVTAAGLEDDRTICVRVVRK